MRLTHLASVLCLLATLAGCDSTECVPGKAEECTGANGCAGSQTCDDEGKRFSECVCVGADAGPGEDAAAADDAAPPEVDAGVDAGTDAGTDAGMDAGSDAGTGTDAGMDAGTDSGPSVSFGTHACNPFTHVPCESSERCSWVDPPTADPAALSCVPEPASPVTHGNACTRDSAGVDDCTRGLFCLDGLCRATCEFSGDDCTAQEYCVAYAGVYSDGGSGYLAGVCTLGCDPVTQLTTEGDPCGTNKGCYLSHSPTEVIATCVQAPATTREQGYTLTGTVYDNSCSPGFVAMLDKDGNPICTALCTPVETWSGHTANIGGEAPHTCAARGAGGAFECRFGWIASPNGDVGDPLLNQVGKCVDPTGRLYDSNGNGTPETPWPSCGSLANTDTNADDIVDHAEWACAPAPPQ